MQVRAEAMQRAAEAQAGTMLSVVGLDDAALQRICTSAAQATGEVGPCLL